MQTVFNCASQPAATLCNGVNVLTGGCVVRNVFTGACVTTCAQACGTLNQTVCPAGSVLVSSGDRRYRGTQPPCAR